MYFVTLFASMHSLCCCSKNILVNLCIKFQLQSWTMKLHDITASMVSFLSPSKIQGEELWQLKETWIRNAVVVGSLESDQNLIWMQHLVRMSTGCQAVSWQWHHSRKSLQTTYKYSTTVQSAQGYRNND